MRHLDLATNEELVKELFKRTTFAGVVIFSADNHRFSGQTHKNFSLMTTLDKEATLQILENGLEGMKAHTGKQ